MLTDRMIGKLNTPPLKGINDEAQGVLADEGNHSIKFDHGSEVSGKAAAGGQGIGVVAAMASTGQPTISEINEEIRRVQLQRELVTEEVQLAKEQLEYYQIILQTKKVAEQCDSYNPLKSITNSDSTVRVDPLVQDQHPARRSRQQDPVVTPRRRDPLLTPFDEPEQTHLSSPQHSNSRFLPPYYGPEPVFDPKLYTCRHDFLPKFLGYHARMNSIPQKKKMKLLED